LIVGLLDPGNAIQACCRIIVDCITFVAGVFMQTLDIARNAPTVPDSSSTGDCCDAYKLLNSTLFEIFARPDSLYPYTVMLNGMEDIIAIRASAVYHLQTGATQATAIASTGEMANYGETIQSFASTLDQTTPKPALWYSDNNHSDLLIKAIKMEGETEAEYALLVLICDDAQALKTTKTNVIEVLTQGFSDIFRATRQAQVNRRQVVQLERASISRELHDSLAQSLTYLKIQASRIHSIFEHEREKGADNKPELELVVNDLRDNLNIAYRQLRELMTTFRLTINGESFQQALEDSVREFEKRIRIAFELDNRLGDDELTIDEEMQVLHIVREALSNIVRHSHAKRARIGLRHHDSNNVCISIKDDGVGIDKPQRRAQHLGLIVMQERSRNLDGNFNVAKLEGGGTEIQITFTPKKFAMPVQRQ
jgi:two-component system nitrate/nitrite sensor histidine kinase NarX